MEEKFAHLLRLVHVYQQGPQLDLAVNKCVVVQNALLEALYGSNGIACKVGYRPAHIKKTGLQLMRKLS